MPLPKPLPDIKKEITNLVGEGDPAKALEYIQGLLPDGSGKSKQFTLIQSKLSIANQKTRTGQLKFEDQKVEVAQVNAGILDLLDALSESDFEPDTSTSGLSPVASVPKFVIIHAESDQPHFETLNRHLKVLLYLKKIRIYSVYEAGGDELMERATTEIADADYILVLITANLFSSPWFDVVIKVLGEGRRMIPIKVEKFQFEGIGLEKFKSLPSMGKAVSDFPNVDSAYADIVGELRKLLPK